MGDQTTFAESAGAIVLQGGVQVGTLKSHSSDTGTITMSILAGVVLETTAGAKAIRIGSTDLVLFSASNQKLFSELKPSVSSTGTLTTALLGTTTRITVSSAYAESMVVGMPKGNTELTIGNTVVPFDRVQTAQHTVNVIGHLKVAVKDATTTIVIQADADQTFLTTKDAMINTKPAIFIAHTNIQSAEQLGACVPCGPGCV